MYSFKQWKPFKTPPIDDTPPNICDLNKKLDEMLEKYLYKYMSLTQGTPL